MLNDIRPRLVMTIARNPAFQACGAKVEHLSKDFRGGMLNTT